MNYLLRLITGKRKLTAKRANRLTIHSQTQKQLYTINNRASRGIFYTITEKEELCAEAVNNIIARGFVISNHNDKMYKITW